MNEVESQVKKMYEGAGVNKSCQANIKFDDCVYSPSDCGYYNYPDFTAEKQLLLILWLLDKTDLCLHRHKTDFTYSIASGDIAANKYKDFKESIAEFINAIWQGLTPAEKVRIKEILE